jgi:putative Mg2+ transporter-C (MgtC) family protein
VRRDSVRGLTTAAGVWVTAAVGSAAGAGLPILAVLTTGIYLLVALAFPEVTRRLPRSATAVSAVRVRYPDGHGRLRDILRQATAQGFVIDDVQAETVGGPQVSSARDSSGGTRMVEVTLHVHGKQPVNDLAASLSDLENVQAVLASDVNAFDE